MKDQFVSFVLGELPEPQRSEVRAHVNQCDRCRAELRQLEQLLACAGRRRSLSAEESLQKSARSHLLATMRHEKEMETTARPDIRRVFAWRRNMTSLNVKITLAAAAILMVAIVGGPSLVGTFLGGSITFAEVIQPILHARTVAVDTILGNDEAGPAIHDVVKGSRIRRTMSNMSNVAIIDLDSGRMLTLDPQQNAAAYVDIQGPVQEGTRSYLGLVREIVTRLDGRSDLPVKQLGRRAIDGREALGLEVREAETQLTIWADPETALPVRIEVQQGQSFTILKNIEFDVPVEDSLVSMDVPAGYTLHETTLDMREFSEQDFIETLRLWAQLALDGKFPDSLRLEDLMSQMRRIGEEIGRLDIPGEQRMQLGLRLWRGYTFFHIVAHNGAYHYAGQGARLGEAGRPVFWYQPQGSATWRVIYADLSTADAVAEDLPK
ncbi:MAG: zf-HC2 domain-containing protein [Phycisphaerae bacterium]|nr:zf-HC2 domain-containing protein [Phycisphaerae bacterium]